MSENTTNNSNVKNDEIDLLDLLRRLGNTLKGWANKIVRAFLISIVFLLKRWLPLGLSIIAGVGISLVIKVSSDSFYITDLTLKNNLAAGTNTELISYINRLHKYCLEKNNVALTQALSLKPENIYDINDINAYWVIDEKNDGFPDFVDYKLKFSVWDTAEVRMQDRVVIRVNLKSPQGLFSLKDAILKYIDSDSLFQQRNRLRLKQNNEMIRRLNYDIVQLDSLQKIKYFIETKYNKPQAGGQMIFLQEQKTQLIYENIHSIYSTRQSLEYVQVLFNGITTILSDFAVPSKRDNGGFYYAKLTVPICFGSVLLILIILANRKKLREVYNKY